MGLLYLLFGIACGVVVGMKIKAQPGKASDSRPDVSADPHLDQSPRNAPASPIDQDDARNPSELPRFPDVEYDLESEEL
jgi:hypothetical protein